jgi:nicotinamide riboside kinase
LFAMMLNMSEVVKVAFVGTSCIGKTSLLEACRASLGDEALYVDEAAREWFMLHPEVADRFGVLAQGEVQALALQKEKKAHELSAGQAGRYSAILCDRSVLDAPVYVHSQGNTVGAQELLGRVRSWLPTYDRIFLLDPVDVPYSPDDIRTEDKATRQLFHDAFRDFFRANELPYWLLSGSTTERLCQVKAFIDNYA